MRCLLFRGFSIFEYKEYRIGPFSNIKMEYHFYVIIDYWNNYRLFFRIALKYGLLFFRSRLRSGWLKIEVAGRVGYYPCRIPIPITLKIIILLLHQVRHITDRTGNRNFYSNIVASIDTSSWFFIEAFRILTRKF